MPDPTRRLLGNRTQANVTLSGRYHASSGRRSLDLSYPASWRPGRARTGNDFAVGWCAEPGSPLGKSRTLRRSFTCAPRYLTDTFAWRGICQFRHWPHQWRRKDSNLRSRRRPDGGSASRCNQPGSATPPRAAALGRSHHLRQVSPRFLGALRLTGQPEFCLHGRPERPPGAEDVPTRAERRRRSDLAHL